MRPGWAESGYLTILQYAIPLSRIAIHGCGGIVKLADKIRYLREVEGSLRGLGRAMTQQELMRAIGAETGSGISQSYLSQIESGARPHLTNTTRLLLARFFKVHPGYLVDDPEGYHAELLSDIRGLEDKLDLWLIGGAERFRRDPKLCKALLTLARHAESRNCLLLLESILETPSLAERLLEVLRPELGQRASGEARVDEGRAGEDRAEVVIAARPAAAKALKPGLKAKGLKAARRKRSK
jgi:transcriptional regulator with XRE-family HTH domain